MAPVFQKFENEDGSTLSSLQTHVCTETDEQYLLWTDIQNAFQGIDHLAIEEETSLQLTPMANCTFYRRRKQLCYL